MAPVIVLLRFGRNRGFGRENRAWRVFPSEMGLTFRQYAMGEKGAETLMPLSTEQQCIMGLGEWEQYCSGVKENVPRTNHLLSWDYVLPGCEMRPMDPVAVIDSMIREGGWSLIGDSLAREVRDLIRRSLTTAPVCDILSTHSPFETSPCIKFRNLSLLSNGNLTKLRVPPYLHPRPQIALGRQIRTLLRGDHHGDSPRDVLSERLPRFVRTAENNASPWRGIQRLDRIQSRLGL